MFFGMLLEHGRLSRFFHVAAALLAAPLAQLSFVHFATTPGEYAFWQPFEGGRVHVTLQALGWTLYASAGLVALGAPNHDSVTSRVSHGICAFDW